MENRKPIDVTIGTNMSKLRKQFNLTQREICSVVGINTSTYKHYELGDRMVPISVLKDLAKFYKVSTNYFFENMPELSDKESLELSNFALKVADNTPKYVKVTFKYKYFDKEEEKTKARIRLRIKNLRLENNKSQKELAKYLEVDLSTYNKYEKGSRKLSNEAVKKLAEYYNVSVSDIVD